MKVAFLDRDGTIIRDYADEKWRNISQPEFLINSVQGLKEIIQKEYQIIIITNQYLIGEKIITQLQYDSFTLHFKELLEKEDVKILEIFYCPHSRQTKCRCHKPNIGLVEQAIEKYPDIDLVNSFFVGDSLCDIQLG